jgi:hypothetical protein
LPILPLPASSTSNERGNDRNIHPKAWGTNHDFDSSQSYQQALQLNRREHLAQTEKHDRLSYRPDRIHLRSSDRHQLQLQLICDREDTPIHSTSSHRKQILSRAQTGDLKTWKHHHPETWCC